MAQFTLELNLPPGIESDDTAFAAGSRWADGNNVRFRGGRPQSLGSYRPISGVESGQIIVNFVRFISSGSYNFGTTNRLYTNSDDVTPIGAPSTISSWSLQPWGSLLLASPRGGTLYQQSAALAATEVTQAPDEITCMLVTQERQVLAFGCNEEVSGTFNGLCIRGCDLEDFTDWTTSSTNNAFEHILDGGGTIRGAALLGGGYVGVWTEDILYMGQFLGDPQQTYRFDRIASGCQLANPRAVRVVDGFAYWVGPDFQLYRWLPGTMPVRVPCPILDAAQETLGSDITKIFLGQNTPNGEVWIFYENIGYIAYCIEESIAAQRPVWFKGDLQRTAAAETDLSSPTVSPVLLAGGRFMYEHERTSSTDTKIDWHLQSADQCIDRGRRRAMVKSAVPDFEAWGGLISLTIYCRDRPNSAAVAKGPYLLAGEATGYLVDDLSIGSGDTEIGVDTGTAGLPAGRVFTIAGVNAWLSGVDTGSLAQFTVTADYAGGSGMLVFTPAIISTGDSRNVVALPLNNAALTFLGTASKKDFRASGMLMAMKVSGSGYMRLGKPTFDCVILGER